MATAIMNILDSTQLL